MPQVINISDALVDDDLDLALRELLTICFRKPQDSVFREHRHFKEPPFHRWIIRGADDQLAAHVTIHDKTVEAGGSSFRVGGVAEVCVHPDYRRRGYVRVMLADLHQWLADKSFDFAMLFGNPEVYTSSGYTSIKNVLNDVEEDGKTVRKRVSPMIRQIGTLRWPEEDVFLPGMTF